MSLWKPVLSLRLCSLQKMLAMEPVAKDDESKYVPLTLHKKLNEKCCPPHCYQLTACYQLSKAVHYMLGCGILYSDPSW